MSTQYAKPENALRKGNDLVKAGKPIEALKILHNILTIKRYRQWTPTHAAIMKLYVEHAVAQRQSAKDAFIQYRSICHEAQTGSLDQLLREYVAAAEARAAQALVETQKNLKTPSAAAAATPSAGSAGAAADSKVVALLASVSDLEQVDSPESLMLQSVSGEDSKARADRQILTPWLKYLWEAYRTALDVLRNNQKLESQYHAIARQAFGFCKTYRRQQEFRRLCEMLRQHFTLIEKYQHQNHPNQIDPNNADTQRFYLETRFEQLRVSSDLELWQEAYRSIEDIYQNMRLSPVPPSPQLMSTYYHKLSQIFQASDNQLFHAYSLSKYFSLLAQQQQSSGAAAAANADQKAVGFATPADRSRLATAVLLATLSIPLEGRHAHAQLQSSFAESSGAAAAAAAGDEVVEENEGNLRLADLLGFKRETPTRARLIAGHTSGAIASAAGGGFAQAGGLLADVSDDGKAVYQLLEKKFGPLSLGTHLYPVLERFDKDELLAKYVAPLKTLAVIRLFQQLATVFKTMKFSKFYGLAPPGVSPAQIEQIVMTGVKQGQLHVRVDHRAQLFVFVDDTFESARLRNQLAVLAERLQAVVNQIAPVSTTDKEYERESVFKDISRSLDREHAEVFERIRVVERRKAHAEEAERERARTEAEAAARAARDRDAIAKKQLEDELAARAAKAAKAEQEAWEKQQRDAAAATLAARVNAVKARAGDTVSEAASKKLEQVLAKAETASKDDIIRLQNDLAIKERDDRERRLKEQWRKLDYFTRATRLEEIGAIRAAEAKRKLDEAKALDEQYQKRVAEQKQLHAKALTEKKRLLRLVAQKKVYHDKLMARRTAEFKVAKAAQDKRLAAAAEARAKAEEARRLEEEAQAAREAEEEEERRKQEEAEQAAQAAAAEARKAKAKEAEEARARLAAVAAKQKAREEELERADAAKKGGSKATAAAAPVRRGAAAPADDADEGEGEGEADAEADAGEGEGEDAAAPAADGDEGEAEAAADGDEGEDEAPAAKPAAKKPAAAAAPAPAAAKPKADTDRWRRGDDEPAPAPTKVAPAAAGGVGKWTRGGGAAGAAGSRFGDRERPSGFGDRERPSGAGFGAGRGGSFGSRVAGAGAGGAADSGDRWRRSGDDAPARGGGRGGASFGSSRGGAAGGSRFARDAAPAGDDEAPAPAPAKPAAKPAAAAQAADGFQTVAARKRK